MNRWVYIISAAAFVLSGAGLSPSGFRVSHNAHALQPTDDDIDSDIEEDIENDVEDDIQADVEDDIQSDIQSDIEEQIEDDVQASVEDDVENAIEDDVELSIESDVENDIEESVEDDVEQGVEDDIEESVENDIEESVEDDVEEGFEDDIEESVEDDVEEGVEDDIEDGVEDEVENEVEENAERELDDDDFESSEAAAFIEAEFEIDLDDQDREYRSGEHIVMLRAEDVSVLQERGYEILAIEALRGLDISLVRIETPAGFDRAIESELLQASGADVELDLNHLYETENDGTEGTTPSFYVTSANERSKLKRNRRARIGLIDTAIATDHPALKGQRIKTSDFAPDAGPRPLTHGTAVASILVGADGDYSGVVPGADLYAASVFFEHSTGKRIATAASLVRALNWMVVNRVPVVNMSLSGPPNDVLEAAILAAVKRGAIVVAAAGNKGPAAAPLYPAGYSAVVAVTAVDRNKRVYRLAGRGAHIDFAAPGANIIAATADGGYRPQTGTSFAAPFAAAAISNQCTRRKACEDRSLLMRTLIESAVDLGSPGFDAVYGHGLITP